MDYSSDDDTSEIDYEMMDNLCVQTVLVADEIFEPNHTNESKAVSDECINGSRNKKSAKTNESKKRGRAPKSPVKENEILLPCTRCCRTISHKNYEKHLAMHTLEHLAFINEERKAIKNNFNNSKVTKAVETGKCNVSGSSIPEDRPLCELRQDDLIRSPSPIPIETVMIKEEVTWCDTENQGRFCNEEEDDPIADQNEFLLDEDSMKQEEICLEDGMIFHETFFEDPEQTELLPVNVMRNSFPLTEYHRPVQKTATNIHSKMSNVCKRKFKTKTPEKRRKTLPEQIKASTTVAKTTEKSETCKICHRKVSSDNMQKHIRTHLTNEDSTSNATIMKQLANTGLPREFWSEGSTFKIDSFCKKCQQYLSPEDAFNHWKTHLDPKLKTCPICRKEFTDAEECWTHVSCHGEHTFVCHHCGQKFITYSELMNHQAKRDDEKRFLCIICYRTFHQCFHLKSHHVAHHPNCQFVVEEVSNRNFETRESSRKSTVPLPDKLSTFICSYCDVVFGCYKELSEHIFTHRKETSVMCTLCRKTVSMTNLAHKRKGVFVCSSCSSSLMNSEKICSNSPETSVSNLPIETYPLIRGKSPKNPVKENEILLPCAYCRRTISYENYEKHLAMHTPEQIARFNKKRDPNKIM